MVYELGHESDQFQNLHNKRRRCGGTNNNNNNNNVNKFITNIAKNYMETTEGENWTTNLINHLNNQFPTCFDTSKGLQNFIQQEVQDANLHQIASSHSSLPDLLVSNSFCPPENYMSLSYNDYNPLSVNVYNPVLCGGSVYNEYGQNVSCGGMNSISPLGVKQTDFDLITSPEQVSSITACSYGDVISDTEAFDSIAANNSFQHQPFYNSQYRSFTGNKRSAYNMDLPVLLVDDVQSAYPNSCNMIVNNGQEIDSEKSLQAQQYVGLEPLSDMYSLQVLSSYVMYKDMPADLRREVSFQDYMHEAECKNNNVCKCHLYLELASHFDKCNDINCNICGPARSNNFHLETKKRKKDVSEATDNGTLLDALAAKFPKLESSAVNKDAMDDDACDKQELPVVNGSNCITNNAVDDACDKQELTVVNGSNCIVNNEMKKSPQLCAENEESEQAIIVAKDDSNAVLESANTDIKIASLADNDSGLEPEKINIQSVSLADFFTADQIKEHLSSFTSQKGMSGNRAQPSVGQNMCQLCSSDKLVFAPAPIYCSSCETRIKRNVGYFRSGNEMGIRHCFCMSCYRGSHGNNILLRGSGFSIPKANLQKAKNDEEKEDSWVLCDKCQCWQHRTCGLYNDEKDVEGIAEYICPKCFLEEIESGIRVPLPQTAVSGAKDLPRTNLSDHIEERLSKRLNQEREEMAKISGIEPNEVPGADGLVVRVVVSVEKQLEVRQKFIDILHGENYPSGFTYRSKKIEGVDVCLFGMCVQEFGSECAGANQRCVYISYLDSVKYFRPERKSVTGESLRTFVYHEILIGYLEYCKKRGFATCYIWACPLIKGEDYIFYCHPETQRTPKQDKLRQWYKSMLKKAAEENLVVHHTNLYNQFFVPSGDGNNTKITAARLPYFEGDYWSGAAENIVRKLELEESSVGGLQSKLPNKRILKAMGQDKVDIAIKDVLVMQKLGQTILPVKENFMIVHLQHICTHCHEVILSGSRWFCSLCKKIQLCSRCLNADKSLSVSKMHTCHSGEKNLLSEVVVNDVTLDTKDTDDVFVNSFFETRDAFLNKCQKSHFQFDTLGRAKYSSMMILYHLIYKPVTKPTCTSCHADIVVKLCWHCDTCAKYYICESCYKIRCGSHHPHRLTPPSMEVVCGSKSQQLQMQKDLMLKFVLDTLMHASECERIPCAYKECNIMRRLFYHTARCSVKARGGCNFCQRVWRILIEHSQICTDSDCKIPRCMDLKKFKEMRVAEARSQAAMKNLQEIHRVTIG